MLRQRHITPHGVSDEFVVVREDATDIPPPPQKLSLFGRLRNTLLFAWIVCKTKVDSLKIIRLSEFPSEKETFSRRLRKTVKWWHLVIVFATTVFLLAWTLNRNTIGVATRHETVPETWRLYPENYVPLSKSQSGKSNPQNTTRGISYGIHTYQDEQHFTNSAPRCTRLTSEEIFLRHVHLTSTSKVIYTISMEELVSVQQHILQQEKGKLNYVTPTMYFPGEHISSPCVCSMYSNDDAVRAGNEKTSSSERVVHMINPTVIYRSDVLYSVRERMSLIRSLSASITEKSIPECIGVSYVDYSTGEKTEAHFHKSAANRLLWCIHFMNDIF
jgi:hypothetical protein